MYGLLKLFYLAAYLGLAGFLLYKFKPLWARASILIAAVLIPNADDWYYRQKLASYCRNEAGIEIYQHASRRDGLLISEQPGGDKLYVKLYPAAFVESPETVGGKIVGYWRTDKTTGGISAPYKTPVSTAGYEKTRVEDKKSAFTEVKEQVIDRKTGVIMGEFKGLYYYGGWYPKALVGHGGLVAGCGSEGQVLSHYEWQHYDFAGYSINEVISKVFSKE